MVDKKRAYIILGLMAAGFIFSCTMIFIMSKWYFKLLFAVPAVMLGVILARTLLAFKRRKLVFTGKVLTVTKPAKKLLPKWTVIMKDGKISKRFYSIEDPKMKIGAVYSVAYEEKSNTILKTEAVTFQTVKKAVSGSDINNFMKFR